jgi:lipoprotein Spr
MKKILSITLTLLSIATFSQIIEFKGRVIDNETSSPLDKAQVIVEDTTVSTYTNGNGSFSIHQTIPLGDQIVSISKDNYETKYLIVNVSEGKKIEINEIKLNLTKKAKRNRKKILKELQEKQKKVQKEKELKLKKAKKEKQKRLKKLKKKKQDVENNSDGDVVITYTPTNIVEEPVVAANIISENQIKYGKLLGVAPQELTNTKLYDFIDSWMGVTYLLGGENRNGIDCSSFSQLLYIKVYDQYIERTAEKQYNSKSRVKFSDPNYLKEGDLMFFESTDANGDPVIGHVGVYLQNGYFVNSTSKRGVNNVKGVQICNINDRYWKRKYVGGARRSEKE